MMIRALCAGIVLSAAAASSAWCGEKPTTESPLPLDVTVFIGHRAHCEQRLSASPADTAATAALECGDLKREEDALRQHYSQDPRVISALNDHWTIIVQRVPVTVEDEAGH